MYGRSLLLALSDYDCNIGIDHGHENEMEQLVTLARVEQLVTLAKFNRIPQVIEGVQCEWGNGLNIRMKC
jgi:hypothetical protein